MESARLASLESPCHESMRSKLARTAATTPRLAARWLPAVLAAALLASGTAHAQLREKRVVTLAAAKKMAAAVEADALKHKVAVTIVVVDDGGAPIYLERMDGAQTGPMEVTEGKARTAAGFGEESKSFRDRIAAGGEGAALSTFPISAAAGGIPLLVGGQTVGAIAVGGAHDALDEELAQAGAAAFSSQ